MKKIGLMMLVALVAGCATSEKAMVQKYQDVTPSRYEGAVAVVLESRESSTVDDKGVGLVEEGFKRIKVLDRKAGECDERMANNCRAVQAVFYDETWDEVELVEARTISPTGKVIPVEPESIRDATQTSWAVPKSSTRAKVIEFKGVEPGAILEWHYRVRTSKLLTVGSFRFQERDPVLVASFSLDAPADFTYKWKTYNIDVKPTEQKKGNRIVRTWTAEQVAPFFPEEGMIAPDDVLAQLKITNQRLSAFGDYPACLKVDSWEAMGACWAQMIADTQKVTPGVQEIVDKIAAQTQGKGESDKVKAVWKYLNDNVRYVALSDGLQGFIPMKAAVVCSKKYGDCKAVAGLISVLCRSLGLKADPILLGIRPALGQVPVDLPGPGNFNHSIARVEADGKVLWLDATVRDGAFDVTPYSDQGVDVVVARPGAPFFDKIPVQPAETNRADGTVVFEPGQDGSMQMTYDGHLTGNYALLIRSIANEDTADQFRKWIDSRTLTAAYPQASLSELTYTGKDDNNAPFDLKIEATIPKALQPAGKGLSFEARSPLRPWAFHYFSLPKRHYPVDLMFLSASRVRYEVKIPEGMEPTGMPRNVVYEDDYLKLERLAQIENDRVVALYDFAFKQLIIPPDKYTEARKAFQKAMDASKFVVIFEPLKKKKETT